MASLQVSKLMGIADTFWQRTPMSLQLLPHGFSASEQADGDCRYFLAKNPKSMARLVAELDAAGLLVTDQRPRPRTFTYADISKLRFLDCVIRVRRTTAQKSF